MHKCMQGSAKHAHRSWEKTMHVCTPCSINVLNDLLLAAGHSYVQQGTTTKAVTALELKPFAL